MTVDSLFRPVVEDSRFVRKIAKFLANQGFTPNLLSILSLIFAIVSGFLFAVSDSSRVLLFLAGIFVGLNAVFDTLDGILARSTKNATRKGDFLEHTFDRYADVFIFLGIIFGGYISWSIGIVAVVGVLLSSYIGVQAQAVGLKRVYGGVLGRADRLLLILAATFLNTLYTKPVIASYSFLGLAILLTAFLSHLTAIQRFIYVWQRLSD